jgi:hypothetical protein
MTISSMASWYLQVTGFVPYITVKITNAIIDYTWVDARKRLSLVTS